MPEDVCGSTDTESGEPCQRPAGWGFEGSQLGPCKTHDQTQRKLRKLDAETKSTLVGAAQAGAKHEHCAMLAGIAPRTLRQWRDWAREDLDDGLETELTEFYLRYQRARAGGAVSTLKECSPEFLAQASYGYTKTERREHEHEGAVAVGELSENQEATFEELTGAPGEPAGSDESGGNSE